MQLRCHDLAVQFYQTARKIILPYHLKNQLQRASSSIALNLAEGEGRRTRPDRLKAYQIAFGSIRECQSIMQLEPEVFTEADRDLLDHLAASTYRLLHPPRDR